MIRLDPADSCVPEVVTTLPLRPVPIRLGRPSIPVGRSIGLADYSETFEALLAARIPFAEPRPTEYSCDIQSFLQGALYVDAEAVYKIISLASKHEHKVSGFLAKGHRRP